MAKLDLIKNKIVPLIEAQRFVARWNLKSEKVVFTNGVFDIMHRGHVEYLHRAADLGDRLIVGLNSDVSAKLLNKGENRPIQDEESRALILAAFTYVDAIVLFDEATPENLIKTLKPNVLVKGGDYKLEEIVGYNFMKQTGGDTHIIPLTPGFSTTNIETKIKGM